MYAWFLILLCAVGFGGGSVFARYAGVHVAWMNTILMTVGAIAMIVYNRQDLATVPITGRQIGFMLMASAINAAALVAFGFLMKQYPAQIPIAQALMPVVTVGGFWILLGEKLSPGQMAGMAFITIGIYLLNKK